MTLTLLLSLALAVIAAIIISWSATYFALRRRLHALHRDNRRLQGEIEMRMQLVREKQDLKYELAHGLARRPPNPHEPSDEGLMPHSHPVGTPPEKGIRMERATPEPAAGPVVGPIREALRRTERRLSQRERDRSEAIDALTERLRSLAQGDARVHAQTDGQAAAPSPTVPHDGGRGELTLERVIELAGMVEHCERVEPDATGAAAADVTVYMPQGRTVAVDAKISTEAFVRAVRASDAKQRQGEMARFARAVRDKVVTLGSAPYGSQLRRPPELVVLFLPGEQFLSAALDADPALQAEAYQRNVLLASPTRLLALLQTIASGWRQQTLVEGAQGLREEGACLYEQVYHLAERLGGGGAALRPSATTYNRAVTALEHQLGPAARRLAELGIDPGATLAAPHGTGSMAEPAAGSEHGGGPNASDDDETGPPR